MELLAPAGGLEQLEYALHFGADAVYLGGERFGLRARACNFTDDGIAHAVKLVHDAGKRIHVTLNSLMHEGDLEPLRSFIVLLSDLGVDAVIVSDMAAVRLVRELAPAVEIHISTQASCANHLAALQWYELGASRIVLARELRLSEIAAIRARLPRDLELEVFVNGAMCMAYSGRCLISTYLTGRDANRGNCTQPCRWNYVLEEEKRPGEYFPVEEDRHGTYIMNSKDLMMLEHLDDLEEAGVDSIKIEGRVKGAYYIATVVNAYRHVLDGADPRDYLPEMEAVSHRPYHTGFFYGPAEQEVGESVYTQTHDWVAVVDSCMPSLSHGAAWSVGVIQRNRFFDGDELEVLSPGQPIRKVIVRELRTELGQACEVANRALAVYSFICDHELSPRDILRRRRGDARVKG